LLLYEARSAFFLSRASIGGDNLFWFYPVYQFFADSLLHGRFPYWDPFTHGGQALYPSLLQLRLLEPISYLVLGFGGLLTSDLTTLFVWDRFSRGLVGALGAYLLLRQWAEHWVIRLLLPPLLIWSSFLLAIFQQTAIIDQFISVPWAAYFVLRIAHHGDGRWRNWLGLALSIGTAWQSYYFSGLWIFLLFLGAGMVLFRRDDLRRLRDLPRLWPKAGATVVLITAMALPNMVVFSERANWVFPARMLDHSYEGRRTVGGPLQYEPASPIPGSNSVFMPYGLVQYTGTFSTAWDFLQVLAPEGNAHARGPDGPLVFGRPSEAFMYVGLLGYVVALWGAAAGQHPLKRVWVLITLAFGLLMLGPSGGLQWLLRIYPPLLVVRHTHVFASLFLLGVLYFFVLGCNRLLRDGDRRPAMTARWALDVAACSAMLVLSATLLLRVTSAPKRLPAVNLEVILLLVPLIALYLMRRRLSALGLCVSGLIAHLALLLWHGWTHDLVNHLAVFLLVPVLLLLVSSVSRVSRHRRWALLAAAVFLLTDLGLYVGRSSWLWHWERPDRVLGVSPFPARPTPPRSRETVLPSQYLYEAFPQPIRYLSLVFRQPTAFSTLMYDADQPEAFFQSARVSVPEAAWPLAGGNRVQPAPSEANVRIPIAADLRGRRLWIRLWVKSGARAADSVTVEADFGGRRVSRSYGNSGEWEAVTLDGVAQADTVSVVLRVLAVAGAPARFDRLMVRANPPDPDVRFDLDLVRSSRRWNTFTVPARYFDLIHADLPTGTLSEVLAIGAPAIQFKPSARFVPLEHVPDRLRELGPVAATRVLGETVLLDTPLSPRPSSYARAGGEGPRISVKDYDYNSLELLTEVPSAGYLYIADGFDAGWRAVVDGQPRPVLPANMAFKAVGIEGGRHEVRLVYRPRPFAAALWVYFVAVGLGFGLLLVSLHRPRNRGPAEHPLGYHPN
jgi:hypothetical protein